MMKIYKMDNRIIFSAIIFIVLFFSDNTFSQNINYEKIDQFAKSVAESKAKTIEGLAIHLTSKFKSENEKVRSIFIWMTENIKYNHRVINDANISVEQRLKKEKPERVLKAKWAVCEGYSNLFNALCKSAGLYSEVVSGIVKDQNGNIPKIGHAWNVVRVNGEWLPIDVTWSAGGLSDETGRYVKNFSEECFLASPMDFIQNHFPKDPIYQLLKNPVSIDDFKKNSEIKTNNNSAFNFKNITDSLNAHAGLNAEDKKLKGCQRILRFNENDSYANFNVAKFHYEKAKSVWGIYQTESKLVFDKKEKLTWEKIEKWEGIINEFRFRLNETEKYLSKIPDTDKYAFNKKTIMSSLVQNKQIDGQIDQQFKEYKRYLEATGAPKK